MVIPQNCNNQLKKLTLRNFAPHYSNYFDLLHHLVPVIVIFLCLVYTFLCSSTSEMVTKMVSTTYIA